MNRLQYETSPYLLQHANNPVDWFSWSEEAFKKAARENKPVLVSIGYSTCHWCHVMEKESFEDKEVAEYMNGHFICIKVDREERPDVDQIYMEACQILSGSGGWPLNCFLLPDKKPFYAGTYYPPMPRHNRPSWLQVLMNISHAFHHKYDVVIAQANRLMDMIGKVGGETKPLHLRVVDETPDASEAILHRIFEQLQNNFDRKNGGFGSAPKFPGTMALHYLLDYHYFFGNEDALEHLHKSLEKMIMGGIYDHLGGGFARYATDSKWLVPHFEKMLYDNALLVSLLSEAYKYSQNGLYKKAVEETLDWVLREMTSPESGFYAALDADSEGVEGKYYVWSADEIDELMGNDAAIFKEFYGVTPQGNWEGHNILHLNIVEEDFAKLNDFEVKSFKEIMSKSREKLFQVREHRIRPGLDDKILLDWNALMCSAFAKAYSAFNKSEYKDAALNGLEFLLKTFISDDGVSLYHSYRGNKARHEAYLDDYSYLVEALLDVYEITFEENLLLQAERYTDYVLQHFFDPSANLFYFTSYKHNDLPVKRKDIYDSATPSGNSVMVRNLLRLSGITGKESFSDLASRMLKTMEQQIAKYPSSFGRWATALLHQQKGIPEIAVLGKEALHWAAEIKHSFIPVKILMATKERNDRYPLLVGRFDEGNTWIYLCHNFTCQKPVNNINDFLKQLKQYH